MNLRSPRRHGTGWPVHDLLGVLLLCGAGIAATWSAWEDIFWLATRDEEQSHVLLVPLVVAWLVWVRRGRLRRCPREGRWIGPALVAAGWLLHSFGDARQVQALWHLGAIVVVAGCFLAYGGVLYLKRLLPAFAALAFAVPVPGLVREQVSVPLQRDTAEATRLVLELVGVEATRSGSSLIVNGQQVLIAEACNGLRMASALFLVSYTFAFSMPIRAFARCIIVALSPLTAVVFNVIRLVPTVWVYAFVSQAAGDRMHAIGGWLMLPLAFVTMLGTLRLLRWAVLPVYRYTLAYGR